MGDKEFMNFALAKIVPIQGDLIQEGCGLSEEDRQMIIDNVNIIINSAASVSFDDSLHDSINMNYFGSMRMFDIGKSAKNLVAYCHVSTAYVNCN
jgi:alcohol-forming fatty acyl-CoA reductase